MKEDQDGGNTAYRVFVSHCQPPVVCKTETYISYTTEPRYIKAEYCVGCFTVFSLWSLEVVSVHALA